MTVDPDAPFVDPDLPDHLEPHQQLVQPIHIWRDGLWVHIRSQIWKRLFTTLLVLLPFFVQGAVNRALMWLGVSLGIRLAALTILVLGTCALISLFVMVQIVMEILIVEHHLPVSYSLLWRLVSSMMLDLLPEPILFATQVPAIPLLTPGTIVTLAHLDGPLRKDVLAWLVLSLSMMLGSSGLFS